MENAKSEELIQKLADLIHYLRDDIAELKISIVALTASVGAQINPKDPAAGVAQIHELENVARQADPNAEQRREIDDLIEAVKLIRKHGVHPT